MLLLLLDYEQIGLQWKLHYETTKINNAVSWMGILQPIMLNNYKKLSYQ